MLFDDVSCYGAKVQKWYWLERVWCGYQDGEKVLLFYTVWSQSVGVTNHCGKVH